MDKKLFVVDTDKDFQNQVESLCPSDQVDIRFFSTCMEIFSLIGKEKPLLIFLNLELPDLSDFVMYDLLKKTDAIPIPVLATYADQSEQDIQQYKKLKFQAKGYYRKPLSNDELYGLLENYLELADDEDDDNFSDKNIDRLVRGELLADDTMEAEERIIRKPGTSQEDTNEHLALSIEAEDEDEDETDEMGADIFIEEPDKKKISPVGKGFQDQVIALQRENEYLSSKNKTLSDMLESLQADIAKKDEKVRQLKSELNKKTASGESLSEQLENRITLLQENKQSLLKEIETLKDYSEKLENQNSDLINKLKTDEREMTEFKNKEHQFQQDIAQLQEEIEKNTAMNRQFQDENDELKKQEESLNRTISTLTEEKVSLSERTATLEEIISQQKKELDQMEQEHQTFVENHNQEMEEIRYSLNFYKNRVKELGEILQNALSLTQNND
jgi:CheY-like chemotaxis protein